MNWKISFHKISAVSVFLCSCSQVDVSGLNPDLFTNAGSGGETSTSALCEGVSADFSTDVLPIFTAKCGGAGCHMDGDTGGGLNLDPNDSKNGDGISGVIGAIKSEGEVDAFSVSQSNLLLKPLAIAEGGATHTGGDLFASTNDTDYKTIFCWIDAGAKNNLSTSECTFGEHVYPIFKSRGCTASACHDATSPAGGMNLSQGSDPLLNATGTAGFKDNTSVVVPDDDTSLILQKPINAVAHDGGNVLGSTADPDYQLLKCWIDEGAQDN